VRLVCRRLSWAADLVTKRATGTTRLLPNCMDTATSLRACLEGSPAAPLRCHPPCLNGCCMTAPVSLLIEKSSSTEQIGPPIPLGGKSLSDTPAEHKPPKAKCSTTSTGLHISCLVAAFTSRVLTHVCAWEVV
jgi:hypothetical protein